jgi:hypothetical protein
MLDIQSNDEALLAIILLEIKENFNGKVELLEGFFYGRGLEPA